ncbi:hypothetical protein V5D56_18965 [Cellulosimicrobium sp. PMB13]|uniref:hypothetical protein n=1 Tax=Cellulosimicrobium sp. PMB13 TaxID=3120158 RepID=UPI003F4B89DA
MRFDDAPEEPPSDRAEAVGDDRPEPFAAVEPDAVERFFPDEGAPPEAFDGPVRDPDAGRAEAPGRAGAPGRGGRREDGMP